MNTRRRSVIKIFTVPYDTGLRDFRHGLGPTALIKADLLDRLVRDTGNSVTTQMIVAESVGEIAVAFDLARKLSAETRATRNAGNTPVVLAGNCNSALGTVSGLDSSVGIIWLDAHADFHTPDTTRSGFLDGMSLSMVMGYCWERLANDVPGHIPVAGGRVVLVGGHAIGPEEERDLEQASVTLVKADCVRSLGVQVALDEHLRRLRSRVSSVYLHIDLDVHDLVQFQANAWATQGGIHSRDVNEIIDLVGSMFTIEAAAITSYDPDLDSGRAASAAAIEHCCSIVRAAAKIHSMPAGRTSDRKGHV
jgi:arginase